MVDELLPFPLLYSDAVYPKATDHDLEATLARIRPARPTGQRDQVLIVTSRTDTHADEVTMELMSRGVPVRRVNMNGFPDRLRFDVETGRGDRVRAMVTTPAGEISLAEINSVWMRRPIITVLHSGALEDPAAVSERTRNESSMHGLFSLLNDRFWVNSPRSLWAAESKIRQLRVASSMGFTIPRTLVTTDPEQARDFYRQCDGKVIVKVFRGQLGSPASGFRMIFTSRVKPEHLNKLDRVKNSPCIFQQEVQKDVELRITVIGRNVFPVEISSQSGSTDWRDETSRASYRPTTLPPQIEAACLELLDHYQLVSAGIDMIRQPDGQHVFLELNAHHEWLWLQRITGLPMSSAMADLLQSASVA